MQELVAMTAGGGEKEEEVEEEMAEENVEVEVVESSSTWMAASGNKEAEAEEEETEGGGGVEGCSGIHLVEPSSVITESLLPSKSKTSYVVDLTSQFDRVFAQNAFNSFREFEDLFNKFKDETGTVFRIKSSCSVAYENSRRKRHFVPARFKFVSVRYCCVHYGQPKIAGQGIRTKQRYLPCGCECMLSLSYSRGALVISQVAMQHNHEVSSQMAPYYAINRRISNAELKQVADMVESMPSSRALQQFLQRQFHRHTTLQDAKNIRARLKSLKIHQHQKAGPCAIRPNITVKSEMIKKEEQEEEEYRHSEDVGGREDLIGDRDVDDNDTMYRENRHEEDTGEEMENRMVEENNGCEYDVNDQNWNYNNHQQQQITTDKKELRKAVTRNLQARLLDLLRDCETSAFMDRVGVLDKIMGCWENGERVDLCCSASGIDVGAAESDRVMDTFTSQLNKILRSSAQSVASASAPTSETPVSVVIPEFDSTCVDFMPSKASGVAVEPLELGVASNLQVTSEQQPCDRKGPEKCVISLHLDKDILNTEICQLTSEYDKKRRKQFLCSRKNNYVLVDTHEEAMEVEIEVNEDVANVKHVKLEPLEYHEVDVS